jgi:CYTH domain-containing protein
LFEEQYKKEQELFRKASDSDFETTVIICDRGLLDNRAYVSKQDFDRYSSKFGLNENKIRCSYDGVFHLVTAADGAEEFYNFENAARTESPEQARALDTELLSVWTGAPHLRIIDNSTGFAEKLDRLLSEVKAVIGIPKPLEIERKFLIEYPDLDMLNAIKTCRKVPITQAYLETPGEGKFRIRKRGEGREAVYIKTVKQKINELTRIETEDYISEKEYYDYLDQNKYVRGVISKDRYCIALNSTYYELDIYPFFNDRATLEIELLSEDQPYLLPDFVKLIREVTFEKQYKNKYLSVVYGNKTMKFDKITKIY